MHHRIAICKIVILVSMQFLMYRCIVYRNNRMYSLEQHDIHTYDFESTSQIIELVLRLKKNVGLFCKKILHFYTI